LPLWLVFQLLLKNSKRTDIPKRVLLGKTMSKKLAPDLCIIGGGSAGLSVAAGAVQMGASVVLIENHKMGGDCLNYGCVPSKALLAAGKKAHAFRKSNPMGIHGKLQSVDFGAVLQHVRDVIGTIEPHDSIERFESLGVNVIQGAGKFINKTEFVVNDQTIKARRYVVATGSTAFVPPIPGVEEIDYLINETIFDLKEIPEHLIVIGGGPIGCELAQAFRHLGAEVSVFEMMSIMPKDDPEAVAVVRQALIDDGINLYEQAKVSGFEKAGAGSKVSFELNGEVQTVKGSHVLIATGRKPNVGNLGLEEAGVAYDRPGISVNTGLRTSNKRIYAAGDVAGSYQFTHIAGYHAGIIVRSALFRLPAKVDYKAIPWVTYTSPEVASVGMRLSEAENSGLDFQILRAEFDGNDRAVAERDTTGFLKVLVTPKGKILGASMVGTNAGELIQVWGLAISNKMKVSAMTSMISPYPTRGEISKRAAGLFYTPKLFSDKTRRIVRFLAWFG
jgi:pyruvate/2-oxoglutarate dehydrogenase complex dihydrolipoamide dehydrogenase (E3) component